MLKTRRFIWTMLMAALATLTIAATGCHVDRKPVTLIEPTFSYLDQRNDPRPSAASPQYQVAAFEDSER